MDVYMPKIISLSTDPGDIILHVATRDLGSIKYDPILAPGRMLLAYLGHCVEEILHRLVLKRTDSGIMLPTRAQAQDRLSYFQSIQAECIDIMTKSGLLVALDAAKHSLRIRETVKSHLRHLRASPGITNNLQ